MWGESQVVDYFRRKSSVMTWAGTDAASESNGNLFTLPSREEENDKVVNHDKQRVDLNARVFQRSCDFVVHRLLTIRLRSEDDGCRIAITNLNNSNCWF